MKLSILSAVTLSLVLACANADELQPVKHLIDTHIHLYDTTRDVKMTWPREDDEVLYHPHLPGEYSKVAKAAGVTGVVIVEASNNLEDNDWVLDLVEDDDFYVFTNDSQIRAFNEATAGVKVGAFVIGIIALLRFLDQGFYVIHDDIMIM